MFGGNEDARLAVTSALSRWPHSAVRGVQRGVLAGQSTQGVSGEVLEDNEGHAYAAYASGVPEGEITTMIVRPDSMVGSARIDSSLGVRFARSGSSSASYEEEQPFSPLSVLLEIAWQATDISIGLIKSGRDKRSQGHNGADAPTFSHNSRKFFGF
ncbi:hypothetical protein DFH07DRAFT_47430 [Mycena maculata]|uniref:Uncharacterized protein n=1 Tax=Mycena maculata TaxID=230809 RepID=A0AAD7K1U4_9AGAR|nr:hypothetical protein DFH07DRAFT_47430 [Mycena maculata]